MNPSYVLMFVAGIVAGVVTFGGPSWLSVVVMLLAYAGGVAAGLAS